jgi:nucleoside-diphosphate-sugar epimerase
MNVQADRMKVLITGGNGFIGSHITDVLLQDGYQVSLLDIKYSSNTKGANLEKIRADIRDYNAVSKAVKSKDVILHLAAVSRVEWGQREPRRCVEVNALGTLTLLEAVSRNNQNSIVILGSSREVYGDPRVLPAREETIKAPINIYGASKLMAENLTMSYSQSYGMNFIILRFSNVYGSPRDLPERVVPKFARLALNNERLPVYGGNQILDFTFIDDVVRCIKDAVKKALDRDPGVINEDFLLSSGQGTSIMQLAKLIKSVFNSQSKIVVREGRGFDVSKFIGDSRKAKERLGFEVGYDLRRGLTIYKNRLGD